MRLDDLKEYLRADGYGALISASGAWGLEIGDFRIQREADGIVVAWTERGNITSTVLATRDEAEACRCFIDTVGTLKLHFGTFRNRAEADALTALLRGAGIDVWRNDIPNFNGPGDARYRIFVDGRDQKRAAEVAPPPAGLPV